MLCAKAAYYGKIKDFLYYQNHKDNKKHAFAANDIQPGGRDVSEVY